MTLRRITAPVAYPVNLSEAKAHLRLDTTDDDALVLGLIEAATEAAEHATGRALMTQTWEMAINSFPSSYYGFDAYRAAIVIELAGPSEAIVLTRIPVQSVTSITFIDQGGAMQTLASNQYQFTGDDTGFAHVLPPYSIAWPGHRGDVNGIKIKYVAGYLSAPEVPAAIKSWILLQIGALYENRESEIIERGTGIPLLFTDRLLDRYRVYG